MKKLSGILLLVASSHLYGRTLPARYTELVKYVQPAPDQGETNTCWFMASTGAMELLLNQRDRIRHPKIGGKNDLSESFLIWQKDFWDASTNPQHFIEEVVIRFNYGEAIHNSAWPYNAYNSDGSDNIQVWNKHPDFDTLPRISVPPLKTTLLFARGRKYATYVLIPDDVITLKKALVEHRAPVIINYNEDGYWHVILIVGYDDHKKGECYEIEESECAKEGAFYVRDSNGKNYELRDYNWFLYKANAAAIVEFRKPEK
jgi:C1A family cysteine protease